MKTGMDHKQARVLSYLFERENQKVQSREIERNKDLRQPEVSIAITSLIKKGWVKREKQKVEGKGRPLYLYKLSNDKQEIIDELIENIDDKMETQKKIKDELLKIKECC